MTRTSRSELAVLWCRLTAEFLGSGFLAAVVIGSGIAAQRLSPGQTELGRRGHGGGRWRGTGRTRD